MFRTPDQGPLFDLDDLGRARGLVTAVLAAVAIGYGWLVSYAARPSCVGDRDAFSSVWIKSAGSKTEWAGQDCDPSSAGTRLARASRRASALLREIGGFERPVSLVLSLDEPLKYAVSSDRIEMGERRFAAEGQIEKAIFKAWVLQNAAPAVVESSARVETASDVLLAMAVGEFRLEDPRTGARLSYARASSPWPWIGALLSTRRACETGWAPFEADVVCEELARREDAPWAEAASEHSMRPVVGALIYGHYRSLSPFARIEAVRAWASWLRAPMGRRRAPRPRTVAQWRDWFAEELEFLYPASALSPSAADGALSLAVARARLTPESTVRLDFFAHREAGPVRMPASFDRTWTAAESLPTGQIRLLPGGATFERGALESVSARETIWESCAAPEVGRLRAQSQSKRVLYVRNCDGREIDYAAYLSKGGEAFARENPTTAFVHLHGPSLDYLLKKGLLKANDSVLSVADPRQGVLLKRELRGEAAWLPRPGAFQVSSAADGDALVR